MKLFSLLTAAVCLLFVSACASTPVPTDERVHVIKTDSATDVQPGHIYISEDAAKVFTFRDVESEINENGYLAVRVLGSTCELSALKWAFFGDVDYEFSYRFFWLDADGNRIAFDPLRFRSTIPGDPVRFVGHAPTEECRNFAMFLVMASESDLYKASGVSGCEASGESDGEADEAAEADAETQAKEDEEESGKDDNTVLPSLPQENVSGDKGDVKTIGVPSDSTSAPAAVPAEK